MTKNIDLKIRDKHDLLTHIGHRMPIIGVKNEKGILVGQCLLSYPSHGEAVKNICGYPLNNQVSTTAIVQSLAVDPDVRGQKIAEKILETAKEIAAMSGHVLLLAKVAQRQPAKHKNLYGGRICEGLRRHRPCKGLSRYLLAAQYSQSLRRNTGLRGKIVDFSLQ